MAAPSPAHLAAIDAVLRDLPADVTPARACVIVEDVYFLLMLGMSLGLSLEQIVQGARAVMLDEALRSDGAPDAGGPH